MYVFDSYLASFKSVFRITSPLFCTNFLRPCVSLSLLFFLLNSIRCDVIAEGVILAAKELDMTIPVIVRLQGTKEMEAKKLIKESGSKLKFSFFFSSCADFAFFFYP